MSKYSLNIIENFVWIGLWGLVTKANLSHANILLLCKRLHALWVLFDLLKEASKSFSSKSPYSLCKLGSSSFTSSFASFSRLKKGLLKFLQNFLGLTLSTPPPAKTSLTAAAGFSASS